MAFFTTQAVTNLQDFMEKLHDFLTTGGAGNPGWTSDRDPASFPGEMAVSKDNAGSESVEVAFAYDTGTPSAVGVYQYHSGTGAGSYNTGNNPWAQANDSGNGAASATNSTILTGRHVLATNTPVRYWCFTGPDTYAHVVVLVSESPDTFVHFGFGVLNKHNDFTGGEYCYGYKYDGGVNVDVAVQLQDTMLLDGLARNTTPDPMQDFAATVHLEGMPSGPASHRWGVHLGNHPSGSLGQDRQATPVDRVHVTGGFRANTHAKLFGQFAGTVNLGLIPTYPIVSYYWERTSDDLHGPLGVMPDVRGILMTNFEPDDAVMIDGDTWRVFPTRRKGESGSLTSTTGHQGILYREVT